MSNTILTLTSHILCVAVSYNLLRDSINWEKLTKVTPQNRGKVNLLILWLSLALGFLVSHLFLEVLAMGRNLNLWLS